MSYPRDDCGHRQISSAQRRHRRGLLRVADRPGEIPRRGADPPHAGLGRMDHRGDAQARPSRLRHHLASPLFPRRARAARTTSAPASAPPAAWPTIRSSATPRAPRPICARSPHANGKVGVIGYCSGGRHAFLVACKAPATSTPGRLLGRQRHRRRSQGAQRQAPGRADRSRRQHQMSRSSASSATTTRTRTRIRSTAPKRC